MAISQSELAHRVIKRLYQLTNKRDAMKQIALKYTRHEFFYQQEEHELEVLAKTPLELPYSIADSRKHHFSLASLSKQYPHDPAYFVCMHHRSLIKGSYLAELHPKAEGPPSRSPPAPRV